MTMKDHTVDPNLEIYKLLPPLEIYKPLPNNKGKKSIVSEIVTAVIIGTIITVSVYIGAKMQDKKESHLSLPKTPTEMVEK